MSRMVAENSPPSVTRRCRRRAQRGQNLVELVMTLPFVIVMLFFIIELGRVWFAYEGAKVAASEGAHAAAMYHSTTVGKVQMDNKIAGAGLNASTAKVEQIPNQHAYQASVTVSYSPFFGGVSIPTLSGPISILPSKFDISYKSVEDVAIY